MASVGLQNAQVHDLANVSGHMPALMGPDHGFFSSVTSSFASLSIDDQHLLREGGVTVFRNSDRVLARRHANLRRTVAHVLAVHKNVREVRNS